MSKKYGRQFLKTISKPATNPPVGFTEIFADIDNDGAIMILTPDGTTTPAGGAEVSYSDTDPAMDGIAAQGTSDKVSRQDHVHPSDTSKLTANSPITPGTGTKITYDASGLVTGSTALSTSDIPDLDAAKVTSGVFDIARIPAAAIERLVPVASQAARYALTTATVQLGDTVKQLDTGIMYVVIDTANLANSAGYSEYTAGSAATVPWSGVSSKPTTLSGYGITDAAALTHTHGNITNTGAIGSTANLPVITGASGVVTVGSYASTTTTLSTSAGTAGTSTAFARQDHTHTVTPAGIGAAASAHTHGNVTSAGAIGSTAGVPIITGTSGVLQAGAFGTAAGTYCQGNDSRLSDARTPTAHTHGNITNTGYIGTTAGLPIVTSTSGIVAAGAWYASTPAAATTTGSVGTSTSPARGDHAHPSRIATSAPASPVNGDIWMV